MTHGLDTGFIVAAEVLEHPHHQAARTKMAELAGGGDDFALAPQVLAEFIHIVTDPKRFSAPLHMDVARDVAEKWWTAKDIRQIHTNAAAISQFFDWHRTNGLGRKRILDTMLAATYHGEGIHSLLTTNSRDFAILGGIHCITP